jgi:membrane fusion protein, multidrug efflux system
MKPTRIPDRASSVPGTPAPRVAARAVALTALALLLTACGSAVTDEAPEPTPVRVTPVSIGPASPAILASGLVASRDEMRLSFKTGGIVRRIAVQEGQDVKRGQVLAEIELGEIDATAEQARQGAAKAQRDLARGESLYADQVISLEQLQDLRTQARVAGAQLAAAQFNLGYSVITAPRDGVILRRFVDERELVPAGQPVVALGARAGGYVVKAALADREIMQIALGDNVEVRLDAFADRTLPGTVAEVSRAADERSGLFPIEVRIDSTPLPLASGLVAKLAIQPARSRTETLVYTPLSAIVEGDGDRASVFLVESGLARRRAVRIAFITNDAAALAEGLEAGEQIVTDGAPYLTDGEAVRVLAPEVAATIAR